MNARADDVLLPTSSSGSSTPQGQMAAAQQLGADAAELASIAAQRSERHRAAQFRKRSGSYFKVHRGRGSNPNSVIHGLAAAAATTHVCKTAVDAWLWWMQDGPAL